VSSWVLVDVERINDAEGELVRLTLPTEARGFFDRNNLACRLKLVEPEHKELVKQLAH